MQPALSWTTQLAILATSVQLAGAPPDTNGWKLRASLSDTSPLLVGESLARVKLKLELRNSSSATRDVLSLDQAAQSGALSAAIFDPDGNAVKSLNLFGVRGDETKGLVRLKPGQSLTNDLPLGFSGYVALSEPGKYTVHPKYETTEVNVAAKPLSFDVFAPTRTDILDSVSVRSAKERLHILEEDRSTTSVDQIKIQDKLYLVYREHSGKRNFRQVVMTARLMSLDNKADVSVQGEHGSRKPLVITVRMKPDGIESVILTVNSTDGTVERQELRRK